jgi:hypothetical protein
LSSLKARFCRGLGAGNTVHWVGQASLQMANLDISLCVWILRWSVFRLLNKGTIGWVIFWFPPNYGNAKQHLARTIYPSCEKPHTYYATNMRAQL